jgi:hypothetical protein
LNARIGKTLRVTRNQLERAAQFEVTGVPLVQIKKVLPVAVFSPVWPVIAPSRTDQSLGFDPSRRDPCH